MRSALIIAFAASTGLTAAANGQPVLYDGTGSPAVAGYAVSGTIGETGFQIDTPAPGQLTLDTRGNAGDSAFFQIVLCSADLSGDDDYDAEDVNIAIESTNTGDEALERSAPFVDGDDVFDLFAYLNTSAGEACSRVPIEIIEGHTVEFAIKLLDGNEETRVRVIEGLQKDPPPMPATGTQGAKIEFLFQGSGANTTLQINDESDPDRIVIAAGTFDFSDFVTIQLLRRPTDTPFFPETYTAEEAEVYINGERINPAIARFDLFMNPFNGLQSVPRSIFVDPEKALVFGDTSNSNVSHAVFDFVNITPGETSVTELGACCLGGSACISVTEAECAQQNGTFIPDSGCFPTQDAQLNGCLVGACCLSDGTCVEAGGSNDCFAMGGLFEGFGTDCADVTCQPLTACCYSLFGGSLCTIQLTEEECIAGDLTTIFNGIPIFADDSAVIDLEDCTTEAAPCVIE